MYIDIPSPPVDHRPFLREQIGSLMTDTQTDGPPSQHANPIFPHAVQISQISSSLIFMKNSETIAQPNATPMPWNPQIGHRYGHMSEPISMG